MSSIYVFCHRQELSDWLTEFAAKKELDFVSFGGGSTGEYSSAEEFVLSEDVWKVILKPIKDRWPGELDQSKLPPKQLGWIDVHPGGIRKSKSKSILLFSEIHGEKCEQVQHQPDKLVQSLKRKIKGDVQAGVVGKNVVHGGESVYKHICFTEAAKELFEQGVVWKQFVDGNAVFEPLDEKNVSR